MDKGELLLTLAGNGGAVRYVCFFPNGNYALSTSEDKTIRMWSLKQNKCVRKFKGHQGGVNCLSFSPDAKHFISGGCARMEHFGHCIAGDLKIWSVETGKCVREIAAHDREVIAVRFLPGGKSVLSGSRDNTIKLWPVNWEVFEMGGEELLDKAQKETMLKLEGFKLVPFVK